MREVLTRTLRKAFNLSEDLDIQTCHRIGLVDFWSPDPGYRILEVGCGPGDTTVVLAAAVGTEGHVMAIEKGPAKTIWALSGLPAKISRDDLPLPPAAEKFLTRYVYGSSQSPGTPIPVLLASSLGKQVTFHVSMDLLDPKVDFAEDMFDMVVFSHCSWYFEHPRILESLFHKVRPWAKRLAYAEWNIIPSRFSQIPHLLAALLQTHVLSLCPSARREAVESGGGLYNIVSVIPPAFAQEMAKNAGWKIVKDADIDCSPLQDAIWEGRVAHELAKEFLPQLDDYARSTIKMEQQLLFSLEQLIGGASSQTPEGRKQLIQEGKIESLSTHTFLAV